MDRIRAGSSLRRVVLLALLAAGASPLAGAPSGSTEHPLTLDEAVARALERNESILVGRESLTAAQAGVRVAAGAYDPLLEVEGSWRRSTLPLNSSFSGAPAGEAAPTDEVAEATASLRQLLSTGASVSLRGGGARSSTDSVFGLFSPAYDSRLGVELRQPLLRDRSLDAARLGLRVAAADRERAGADLRREVSETVAAVEAAYWRLAAARLEVGVRDEATRLAGEQLEETRARIESGAAPEAELAQPQAELERRRGELLAAREAMSRAENALKLLILGDGDEDRGLWSQRLAPVEDAATAIEAVDVASELDLALAGRSEVAAARSVVERRRLEAAFARDRVRPVLDAVASYDRFGLSGRRATGSSTPPASAPLREGDWGHSFDSLSGGDYEDTRIALVFGVPLGNRAARGAAAIAGSVERQAEADLIAARKAVRAEVLDAAAAIDTAAQRIEAARAGRTAAEVQLASERERYSAGLSTNFLVLTRQNDLSRARLDEIAALTDYRTARTELLRSTGALLAARGVVLDSGSDT